MSEITSAPAVMAALVSALVTVLLFFIKGLCTPLWNKYLLVYKIKVEHSYEQKKKNKRGDIKI
jgi:hypothetical protein